MNFITIFTASKILVRELKLVDPDVNLNVINNYQYINKLVIDFDY